MRFATSLLVVAVLFVPADVSRAGEEPDSRWRAAVTHLEAGRHAEAVPLLREVDLAHPDNPSVLWNLGIALAAVADHSAALATWERLSAQSDDWRVLAKRIQSNQTLGRNEEVLRLREQLIALRASEDAPEDLAAAERYCREQFHFDEQLVFAYEHFEPKGRRMVFFSFVFAKPSGEQEFVVSLGSYEDTTQTLRELGELAPDARTYHLDRYEPGFHATYAFFDRLLSYAEAREVTLAAVRRNQPLSTSGSREAAPARSEQEVSP